MFNDHTRNTVLNISITFTINAIPSLYTRQLYQTFLYFNLILYILCIMFIIYFVFN